MLLKLVKDEIMSKHFRNNSVNSNQSKKPIALIASLVLVFMGAIGGGAYWFLSQPKEVSESEAELNKKTVEKEKTAVRGRSWFDPNLPIENIVNGIKLQIWATWLFYAVLVDLGDAIADEISLPVDHISLEMVYRGLYYFHGASCRGEASDPVKYFAQPDIQKCLAIVKRQRKPKQKLIIAPFPDKQRNSNHFFFQSSSQSPLTSCFQA